VIVPVNVVQLYDANVAVAVAVENHYDMITYSYATYETKIKT